MQRVAPRSAVAPLAALALAALALAAVTLVACVQPVPLVIETSSGAVVPLVPWTATLGTPVAVAHDTATTGTSAGTDGDTNAPTLSGTVTLAPGGSSRETRATLILAGGAPAAEYLWYVHLGRCGFDHGILNGPAAYPPIAVDRDGHGTAMVLLPFTLPTSGRYFVSVHEWDAPPSVAVACGNLTREGESAAGAAIARTP
jgi:hypothetical protein